MISRTIIYFSVEKLLVLDGDFRQLLPIKVHGTRSEIVNLSIKFSST